MSMKDFRTIVRTSFVAGAFAFASVASGQSSDLPYGQGQGFFDRPSFIAALGTTQMNDLNSLPNGSTVISFGSLGTGTLSGATVQNGRITNPNPRSPGDFTLPANPFTFSITFSQLLNGFGADYSGFPLTSYRYFNGTTRVAGAGLYGGSTGFLGSVEVPFNRVEISEIPFGGSGPTIITSLDNLTVGVTASTVPEPATVGLFATGLLAVGGLARRRRRNA
jgi:hypothetical protein